MTTANKVTVCRILLVPVFIVEILYYFRDGEEIHRIIGLACFALASIMDGVDGYIARRFNQRSELGAILDPLADKLLLVSAVVLLSLHPTGNDSIVRIPLWVTAAIISRDTVILIGMVLVHMFCGHVHVHPRIAGKIATVLQMIMVIWRLLKWDAAWLPWWTTGAGVFTAISGVFYVYDGMTQLSASPRSSPKEGQGQRPNDE
jgi:CDP-diacylglycerol--glycerol-3-phosphate 3-phosphatidyltransferase